MVREMATLKEFEDTLREHGMTNALAMLEALRKRDREKRSIAPARRISGKKMTADLARHVLELHATTGMTQQEIAFKVGVNQGRVNEVIKRGKWLSADAGTPAFLARDKAIARLKQRAQVRRTVSPAAEPRRIPVERAPVAARSAPMPASNKTLPSRIISAQLAFLDL